MSEKAHINDLFKEYYKNEEYIVDDIIHNDSKYIFILESPYKEELIKRIPAAGLSGKSMSKFLGIDEDKSLGEIADNDEEYKISIMNISKVPLDIENLKSHNYNELTKSLALVRTGFEFYGKHRDKEVNINEIEKLIQSDFENRIKNFIQDSPDAKFIICGRFAQKHFELSTNMDRDSKKVLYVPHPSRNQWNYSENDLNILKGILQNK